jgi:hypothetical protein
MSFNSIKWITKVKFWYEKQQIMQDSNLHPLDPKADVFVLIYSEKCRHTEIGKKCKYIIKWENVHKQ